MATPGKFTGGDKTRGAGPGGGASGGHRTRQPRRWLRNGFVLLVLLIAGVLASQWSSLRERTLIGSAYAARIGCVCHFVSRRDLKACEADLEIGKLEGVAGMVSLGADEERQTLTAGLPILGSQTAHYSKDYGCRLGPWED